MRAWLAAYAGATATTTSYNAILDAATPGDSDKPAKTTTIAYRDVLSQLWLLDPVSGWSTSRSAFTNLASAPKHHLADPALAARLLGVDVDALLSGSSEPSGVRKPGPLLGALFESLDRAQPPDVRAGCRGDRPSPTDPGRPAEVDFIVQRADQRIVALEVKLTPSVHDDDVAHLNWLQWQLGDGLLDAAVITTGADAYRRPDGIAVVPAALLGP